MPIDLSATDVDHSSGELVFSIVQLPGHGSLKTTSGDPIDGLVDGSYQLVGNRVLYTPAPDVVTDDAFTFSVRDASGGADAEGQIQIIIDPVRDPLIAVDQTLTTLTSRENFIFLSATKTDNTPVDPLTTKFFIERVENGILVDPISGLDIEPPYELSSNIITYRSTLNFTGDSLVEFYAIDDVGLPSTPGIIDISVNATTILYPIEADLLSLYLNAPAFLDALRLGSPSIPVTITVNNTGQQTLDIKIIRTTDFNTVTASDIETLNTLIIAYTLDFTINNNSLKDLGVILKNINHAAGSHIISSTLDTSIKPIKNVCICPPPPILDKSHTAYTLGQAASRKFTRINMARNSRNRYTIPIQQSTRQNLCNRSYDVNVSSCVNIPDTSNIEYIDDVACDDPARQVTGNLHISNCSNGSGSTVNLNTNTVNNTNIKLDIQTDVVVTETGIQQHINTVMGLNNTNNQNTQNRKFSNQRVNGSLF